MKALLFKGLLVLVSTGCTSLQSVSVTNIPRERGKPVEATANNPAFLGIHFDNDFADDLPDELRAQCANGKVTGIYSKYESTWYVLVQNRSVTAKGYCVPNDYVTVAPTAPLPAAVAPGGPRSAPATSPASSSPPAPLPVLPSPPAGPGASAGQRPANAGAAAMSRLLATMLATTALVSCMHSVHQVAIGEHEKLSPAAKVRPVEVETEQKVFLGTGNTDFADEAMTRLAERCPGGRVVGLQARHSTSLGFLVHTNRMRVTGYCVELL
jgi:hypothetical protein